MRHVLDTSPAIEAARRRRQIERCDIARDAMPTMPVDLGPARSLTPAQPALPLLSAIARQLDVYRHASEQRRLTEARRRLQRAFATVEPDARKPKAVNGSQN